MSSEVVNEFALIHAIKKRVELWDTNCVQFRNKDLKQRGWASVAAELGNTVEDCTNAWKKLRDRYTRTKRQTIPSGSEGGRRPWDKESLMKFLDKVLVTRKYRTINSDKTLEAGVEEVLNNTTSNTTVPEGNVKEVFVEQTSLLQPLFIDVDNANAMIDCETPSPSSTSSFHSPHHTPSISSISQSNDAVEHRPQSVSKKRKRPDDEEEVTSSLVNAINKLVDIKETSSGVEDPDPVMSSFIAYHTEQLKQLLVGKSSQEKRRIRNRLIMFIDELHEEFTK